MWFRKREDPEALYVARQCGISLEFGIVGPVIHETDLEMLRTQLFDVSKDTMSCLFEKTILRGSDEKKD